MLRFDLNLSIAIKDRPFLERFAYAAALGFDAVEFWWPAGEDPAAVARAARATGVAVALFNFDAGDMPAGDRGLLNDPERQAQFRANVPVALELAHQVGCERINALAGHWRPGEDRASQLARVRENLAWAAEQARAAGVEIVVEAVNTYENGPYLFSRTDETLAFLDSVGAPNLRFQYDIYHMQRMEGNIIATLRAQSARIGHIQIADSPGRNQPGTGELRFSAIFQAIEETGYAGSVGLEYNPLGTLEESLAWLPTDRRGAIDRATLRLT